MFHYRWSYAPDQQSAAERIARQMMPGLDEAGIKDVIQGVKGRMIPRLKLVGSSAETRETIEGSYLRQLDTLEKHFRSRKYLFGARPALADFGLYAQLYECSTDPTPGAILRERAPHVLAWIERMLDPSAEGGFESWDILPPTLAMLLRDEVGAVFLPWTIANARALATGEKTFSLTLSGKPYAQEVQKYHARSLAALRARYAAVADTSRLNPVLAAAGCLEPLRGGE
jgi:Glutathione S-transferase, C-terminal domain